VDGLAIQARDGASRKALRFAARCAMAAWDAVIAEAASRISCEATPNLLATITAESHRR